MARIIEERWVGIRYDVVDEQGRPKMRTSTTLVFILDDPGAQRVVRVPFMPEAKQELVRKLTGGIVIGQGPISI